MCALPLTQMARKVGVVYSYSFHLQMIDLHPVMTFGCLIDPSLHNDKELHARWLHDQFCNFISFLRTQPHVIPSWVESCRGLRTSFIALQLTFGCTVLRFNVLSGLANEVQSASALEFIMTTLNVSINLKYLCVITEPFSKEVYAYLFYWSICPTYTHWYINELHDGLTAV